MTNYSPSALEKLYRLCTTDNLIESDEEYGVTVLMFALKYNETLKINLSPENFDYLIKNSNLNQQNTLGQNAFMVLCQYPKETNLSPQVWEYIYSNTDLSHQDKQKKNMLLYALDSKSASNINFFTEEKLAELALRVPEKEDSWQSENLSAYLKNETPPDKLSLLNVRATEEETHKALTTFVSTSNDDYGQAAWETLQKTLGDNSYNLAQLLSLEIPGEQITYMGQIFTHHSDRLYLIADKLQQDCRFLHLDSETSIIDYVVHHKDDTFLSLNSAQHKILLEGLRYFIEKANPELGSLIWSQEAWSTKVHNAHVDFVFDFWQKKTAQPEWVNEIKQLEAALAEVLKSYGSSQEVMAQHKEVELGKKLGQMVEDFEVQNHTKMTTIEHIFSFWGYLKAFQKTFPHQSILTVKTCAAFSEAHNFDLDERELFLNILSGMPLKGNYTTSPYLSICQEKIQKDKIMQEKMLLETELLAHSQKAFKSKHSNKI